MFGPETAIYPFPPKPVPLSVDEERFYREETKRLLKERDAVMAARYYTDPEIQQLAEETGGCISDSLEMARSDSKHSASTLLITGVRFTGGAAKILSPRETILMLILQAECSLDLGCPIDAFGMFYDAHPDHTMVAYANTSAAVKIRADWIATSSIVVELIGHPDSLGEKIIWIPDRYLGSYVQEQTGADVPCWQGACIVHDEFKIQALTRIEGLYPDATILIHSESPQSIVDMVDAVSSTSQLVNTAKSLPHQQLIMAIGQDMFYKMQQAIPDKELLKALMAGEGATCCSCAHRPWMATGGLKVTTEDLEQGGTAHGIHVNVVLREGALLPLNRILEFMATF